MINKKHELIYILFFRASGRYIIRSQGVEVGEETPLFQLWTIFAHSDLFLYITVSH